MNRALLVVLSTVFAFLPPTSLLGQHNQAVPEGYVIRVTSDWTYLNTSVTHRTSRRVITNLTPRDFLITEDGQVQKPERCLDTESPFRLLLLLDVSASTMQNLNSIKDSSIDFATRLLKPRDEVAIATFNSDVRIVQPYTSNRGKLIAAIRSIRAEGETHFYDALMSAVAYCSRIPGRKAIVVFSDGVDNSLKVPSAGSRTGFDGLLEGVRQSDTLIYTIFAQPWSPMGSDVKMFKKAKKQMQDVAAQTGGRMYTAKAIPELKRVYTEIAQDLRSMYTLVYRSPADGVEGWREVRVVVRDHPEFEVRTRKGYLYDQEPQLGIQTVKPQVNRSE